MKQNLSLQTLVKEEETGYFSFQTTLLTDEKRYSMPHKTNTELGKMCIKRNEIHGE